jgi:hypothetical protein
MMILSQGFEAHQDHPVVILTECGEVYQDYPVGFFPTKHRGKLEASLRQMAGTIREETSVFELLIS